MSDEALTDSWEACSLGRSISHEEHLRIARVLLQRHGRVEGERRILDGTRRNCEAMDAAERVDEALTHRWIARIANDLAEGNAETFERFIALHADLLRSDLLGPPRWKVESRGRSS